MFQNFLKNNNITPYSRNTYLGAVFAEKFNRTIRDLLRKPVFGKSESNCIDVLPTTTKRYSNRFHSSTKITPIEASLKQNEGYVYRNLLDKQKKTKPKFQVNNLVRTGDSRRTFWKGDTTN